MKEFVIAHLLDRPNSNPFTMWPFHLTIMPPFEATSSEAVEAEVRATVASLSPVTVKIDGQAVFGNKRSVQKITPNSELQALHEELLTLTKKNDWPVSGRYTGAQYLPHLTARHGKGYEAESFVINNIHIVESLPQGYRKVVAEIELAGDE